MRRIKPVFVFFLLSLLSPGRVFSDNWSVKGNVNQDLSYDDNVCMQPDGQTSQPCGQNPNQSGRQGSFKYRIIPLIIFEHQTDVSDVSASASYGTQLYTDIDGFDQDVQNYTVNGQYQTEIIDWGLKANYSVTPTRNNAVQNSGIFSNNLSQNTWAVSPFLTYKVNAETDSITFSPGYTETTFTGASNNQSNNFFNNSTSYSFDLAWQHLWSLRYLSELSFFYSNFESAVFDNSVQEQVPSIFDNFGINFSNTYQISDKWKLDATIGGRYTESEIGSFSSTSFGFLADVGIDYTEENYAAGLHFMRGLIPASQGQLQEQTSVGLNFNYNILQHLSTRLNFSYQETTVVNSTRFNNINLNLGDRTNFVIEPSVNWQFAQDWTLGGSYRYRFQDGQNVGFTGLAGEADSNLFLLSVNYNWQGISKTR